MAEQGFADLFVSASDGLRLHARDYGPRTGHALPVVCLPGLTRTAADFHELAIALASEDSMPPRRVLAIDYRGRGQSEHDKDWRNYDVRIEFNDVLQVLMAAGIAEAVFVGTSRGGLVTMALATARPALVRAAVLNDIGPKIDAKGLIRIRGYVGKLPQPRTYDEAVEVLQRLQSAQFPKLSARSWLGMARGTWTEHDGKLVPAYDPNLMKTLESIDLEQKLPTLWHLFEALKPVPVLALRGANSDILSADALRAMAAAHPRLDTATIPDQGHAPLMEGDVIGLIRDFADRAAPAAAQPQRVPLAV